MFILITVNIVWRVYQSRVLVVKVVISPVLGHRQALGSHLLLPSSRVVLKNKRDD